MRADILVIGDVMTDVIVRPEGALLLGTDRAATIRLAPGGSGANQAAWIGRLGGCVAFAGRVGVADHAQQVALLRRHGVMPVLAADPDLPTGMLVSILSPDGERSFLTDRGANTRLAAADLPQALLDGLRLLHVSGYALFSPGPRAAVLAFAQAATRRGIPVSLDAASAGFLGEVGAASFLEWTRGVAICFANADEAATLTGTDEPDAQRDALATRYRVAVVKRGRLGADMASGAQRWHEAAPVVTSIDSTGAGDAFLAAFLVAYAAGTPLPACLANGVTKGAEATTFLGGRPAA